MDPNETLRRIDEFLARRETGDEVDYMVEDLFRWIEKGGFEPDWSRYPLGTSYYRSRVAGAKRGGYANPGTISISGRRNPGARRNIFAWNNSDDGARRNIFAWNNPGREQAWLAEQFVKGANSGVAGSLYVHGKRIYSYGPHFPIAERRDDGTILIRHPSEKAPSRTTAGHISLVLNAARQVYAPDSILYDTAGELSAEAAGPAGYSNPLTRAESGRILRTARGLVRRAHGEAAPARHIMGGAALGMSSVVEGYGPRAARRAVVKIRERIGVSTNPAGEGPAKLREVAKSVGLHIDTWAPGDGVTRYRFFTKPSDYFAGDGLYTALGLKEAWCFLRGYVAAKMGPLSNPLTKAESKRLKQWYEVALADARREHAKGNLTQASYYNGLASGYYQAEAHFRAHDPAPPVWENPRGRKIVRQDIELAVRTLSRPGTVAEIDALSRELVGKWFKGYPYELESFIVGKLNRMRGDSEFPVGQNPVMTGTAQDFISKKIGTLVREGYPQKQAVAIAYSMARKAGYRVPARPNGSVRAYKVPSGLEAKVASMLRNAFIWAQARDGEVLTLARPEIVKRAIAYVKKHPYANPLTRTETAEVVRRARDVARSAERAKRFGHDDQMRRYLAYGRGMLDTAQRYTPKGSKSRRVVGKMQSRYHHIDPRESSRMNPLPNPLLQTVMLANPPIDRTWDTLTRRQRQAALEFAGIDQDFAWLQSARSWGNLTPVAQRALLQAWHDTARRSSGQTTIRRLVRTANPRRAVPRRARPVSRPRTRVITTTTKQVKRVVGNPGNGAVRIPFREGQRVPIEQARAWVRRLGNPELLRQFEEAERLQTKANRKPRFVYWKTLPIGSPKKIEMLTAFAHYGDSPETLYKPPKGSRKGRHMYRHEWGDGSGRPRPVPVLAAPGGKAIIKVMGPGQKTGDWMRG